MDKTKISPNGIEQTILRRIPFEITAVSSLLSLPAYLLFDFTTAYLFWLGGLLGALSFWSLKASLTKTLANLNQQKTIRLSLFWYIMRLLLIVLVFFIIILVYQKRVLAFALGFSLLLLVIMIEAIYGLISQRKWKN
ncbi:MAG: hypothetical protein B5M54_01400 [Candidatus Aminicenantes bacterium 4484_214]|nr:MAG: hypothetical protein B5M54_01400 [Candidatus Aminicenantes bacterium 4484_214]RLE10308.1 MAG: hypothetical protein DRJ06_01350 [Candidatus Aminicenantes bacterium]